MADRYPKIWLEGRPQRLHRAVAEVMLGRALLPGEVVHHKDGDRWNSAPSNLEVLPSQRVHAMLEHYQRREARGTPHLFTLPEVIGAAETAPRPVCKRHYRKSDRARDLGEGLFPDARVTMLTSELANLLSLSPALE